MEKKSNFIEKGFLYRIGKKLKKFRRISVLLFSEKMDIIFYKV